MGRLRSTWQLNGTVWTARFEPDGLSLIRSGRLLLDGLAPTLRDGTWRTIPLIAVDDPFQNGSDTGTDRAEIHLRHDVNGEPAIAWVLTLATRSNTATVTVHGVCQQPVQYRRAGLCLQLPTSTYIGSRLIANPPAAPPWQGQVRQRIEPQLRRSGILQPLGPAFRDIRFTTDEGQQYDFCFRGDDFEIEDQRNWSDPSLKIYCTALEQSRVRELKPGDVIDHSVEVTAIDPGPASQFQNFDRIDPFSATRTQTAGSAPSRTRTSPEVVQLSSAPWNDAAPALATIGLRARASDETNWDDVLHSGNHVRIDADCPPDRIRWDRVVGSKGVELVLSLDLPDAWRRGWLLLAQHESVRRVLLARPDRRTVSRADLAGWLRLLNPVWPKVVTGTADQFSELNRNPDSSTGSRAVAFGITAQAHQTSDRSVLRTLATHTQLAAQASALHPGRAIVVSAATLARHELSDPVTPDPRTVLDIGIAWTAMSLIKLSIGGAVSVTFHEPVALLARCGRMEALASIVGRLAALAGSPLGNCTTSRPGVVEWAQVGMPDPTMIIVNLTSSQQVARVPDGRTFALDGYGVEVSR